MNETSDPNRRERPETRERPKRVAVLMGGLSGEREVSLHTGEGAHRALVERDYQATMVDWTEGSDLRDALRGCAPDAVWIALHGAYGEDGCVQGFLECLRIPYTGSGVTASALAMDKVLSKRIFDEQGVPTPPWKTLSAGADPYTLAGTLGYPLVVKPSREGSTLGLAIPKSQEELAEAAEQAGKYHGEVLFERFVAGREVSVGILEGRVLGTVEIRPKSGVYDYEAKYLRNDTEYLVPAPLSPTVDHAVRAAALRAYQALGCWSHARVDVRIDSRDGVWVLEVNTLPGMTGTSLLPKIAKHAGVDYPELVERILLMAKLQV
ncbi:MAG: D-alanine--D-alanine ligase [Pseudomonadota bacterium]